jgi:SHAQKYF class myb-like DNA-binding protein
MIMDDEDRKSPVAGRWTAEEHHMFLRGLKRHGRAWSKIAKTIPNRTTTQVRTHAQKYFIKVERARASSAAIGGGLTVAVSHMNQVGHGSGNSPLGPRTPNLTVSIYFYIPRIALIAYVVAHHHLHPAPGFDNNHVPSNTIQSSSIHAISTGQLAALDNGSEHGI